jgi:NAD(P)-dependent dehydrogenase (short-subunit alcohol dehydrogenase family)
MNIHYPGRKLDAIFAASGGFAIGNASSADLLAAAESLVSSSLMASLVASKIATSHLSPGGLLVLVGASAAASATPWAVAYGAAKAAVHQLVRSLGAKGSGLPDAAKVVGIAPVMLDTAANRLDMSQADKANWTPVEDLSEQMCEWLKSGDEEIASGSLLKVVTRNGQTSFEKM